MDDKIPTTEIYIALRKGIEAMIKQNPDAKATDVLKMLSVSEKIINMMFESLEENK